MKVLVPRYYAPSINLQLLPSCPYTTWDTLSISPASSCNILDTFHDVIKSDDVIIEECSGNVFVNSTVAGTSTKSAVVSSSFWLSANRSRVFIFDKCIIISWIVNLPNTT